MPYSIITLKNLPQVRFAHHYATARYEIPMPRCKNRLEIAMVEKGPVTVERGQKERYVAPEYGLIVAPFDDDYRFYSRAPLHAHSTVGLTLEYELRPISPRQVIALHRAPASEEGQLPYVILPYDQSLTRLKNGKIEASIQKLVYSRAASSCQGSTQILALVFQLFSEITRECVSQCMAGSRLSPGDVVYADRAIAFISRHIGVKIYVTEIAEHLGISTGYLSGVFKAVTGQTLVEYISRAKIQIVKELLTHQNLSLREAGEAVGIEDANYLSRLIRKYTGATARQFKKGEGEFTSELSR